MMMAARMRLEIQKRSTSTVTTSTNHRVSDPLRGESVLGIVFQQPAKLYPIKQLPMKRPICVGMQEPKHVWRTTSESAKQYARNGLPGFRNIRSPHQFQKGGRLELRGEKWLANHTTRLRIDEPRNHRISGGQTVVRINRHSGSKKARILNKSKVFAIVKD